MIFKTDAEVFRFIKENEKVKPIIQLAREQNKTLLSLVEGDDFKDELINNIEFIESDDKAKSRRKHSRSITDFYERLLNPISNVFSATGGSKKYDIDNEDDLTNLMRKVANIRGGKSIENFVENKWMPLYHVDPNGVIFMEYDGEDIDNLIPTYKSIGSIRYYKHKGQLLDVILFEPKEIKLGRLWRLVDDVKDYTVLQKGNSFIIVEDATFEHPFGEVPGLIISDIIKINKDIRLPPIHAIVELSKEYARDQSIKTLYKFFHGFPIFWKYVAVCKTCHGVGKTGEKHCKDCQGKGFYTKKDITDVVTLPVPSKEEPKLAPDIAGYITPDLETWAQYTSELELLERIAEKTHWGTVKVEQKAETATARFIDTQPVINRLTKYSASAEFVERKITEWTANFIIPTKDKAKPIASISYGRRYIIEPPDVILKRYEEARKNGDNTTILDRLLNEYITAKYRTDPAWLRLELLKIEIEPHIHYTLEQVKEIFGSKEAQKKMMFEKWWKTLREADFIKQAEALQKDYITWFNKLKIEENDNNNSSS